jgi:tripartite ATP-independent transporter DctM subunit
MVETSSARRYAGLFSRARSDFDQLLEKLCILLFILLFIFGLMQIFSRYVLRASPTWTEELCRWIFIWTIFLGMAVAVRRDDHIKVDMFLLMMPPRLREGFELIIHALVVTTCIALFATGWDYTSRNMSYAAALGWPLKYEFAAVPVGAAISLYYLALQSFSKWSSRAAGVASFAAGVAIYLAFKGGPGFDFLATISTGTILLVAGLGLLLLGVPVAFAMVLASFLALWPKGNLQTLASVSSLVGMIDSFVLLAVPFFIVAGELMNEGGITESLVRLASSLVGHIRGGLGQVSFVVNAFMGGLSGSSTADAVGIAKVMVPSMVAEGYNPAFAASMIASGAVLANVIPPSICMLVYGPLAGVSIGKLFIAGFIPGIVLTASLMTVCYIYARRSDYGGGTAPRAPFSKILSALRHSSWALGMPAIIVIGINSGAFTPTEAAAIAALYSLIIGFVGYKGLRWQAIPAKLNVCMVQTVTIMLIVGASAPFGYLLVIEEIPQLIAAQFSGLASSPMLLLMLLNIFLLLVGLPLEPIPAITILVPILGPIITAAGIDPIHFGIIIIINLMIGALTPPVGSLVFVTAGVTKVPVHQIFIKVIPFELAMVAAMFIISFFPFLSLWLPSLIVGR